MHSTPDGGCAVTLLTVNTHKGFTKFNGRLMLDGLRTALRRAAPDIVFLQEVIGAHAGHAARVVGWPASPQYEFLADTLWPEYAYGRNAVYPDGHHGNALLSRYPITRFLNHDVTMAGSEARGLLHCVLQPPGLTMPLHAICVHLGLRESHRRHQMRRLCELARDQVPQNQPLLIAGDFNDWGLRADSLLAACGASEVFSRCLGRPARSFPAVWPLLRLDRIYVRGVRCASPRLQARRDWTRLSDHVPLAAEVVL